MKTKSARIDQNKFSQASAAGRRLARRRTCSSPSAICGSASACAMLAVMDVGRTSAAALAAIGYTAERELRFAPLCPNFQFDFDPFVKGNFDG
jgi:hypothetical protein